jgi:hypothetical protein
MAETIVRVRAEWDDWAGYAESIGVDAPVRAALRDRLLV